jgi:nickel-dependent lactate racemase
VDIWRWDRKVSVKQRLMPEASKLGAMKSINYVSIGGLDEDISDARLATLFSDALRRVLTDLGKGGKILVLPPDLTRIHSRAGFLTDVVCQLLETPEELALPGWSLGAVIPALGSHRVMGNNELKQMFQKTPLNKFVAHDWRKDTVELGRLEADWVAEITNHGVNFDWPVQVNRMLQDREISLVISIGQVVPHELAGMANHAKNIFVGTGGKEAIDKSHYVGAVHGIERVLGRTDNPVRALFDEGYSRFGKFIPPVLWVLTVVGLGARGNTVRGFFVGFGREPFEKAAALSQQVNINYLDEPLHKAVVWLDPGEFRSTWVGNKAVYRTRMAMADGGELIILAPGLEGFGESPAVDALIRKEGYHSEALIRKRVIIDQGLMNNLGTAAHLILGCVEKRFTVRYCPGPEVSRTEIESVGFEWGNLEEAMGRYNPHSLKLGENKVGGEDIFFIPNPALGLWTTKKRFAETSSAVPPFPV